MLPGKESSPRKPPSPVDVSAHAEDCAKRLCDGGVEVETEMLVLLLKLYMKEEVFICQWIGAVCPSGSHLRGSFHCRLHRGDFKSS
jgi:hypothetical protein